MQNIQLNSVTVSLLYNSYITVRRWHCLHSIRSFSAMWRHNLEEKILSSTQWEEQFFFYFELETFQCKNKLHHRSIAMSKNAEHSIRSSSAMWRQKSWPALEKHLTLSLPVKRDCHHHHHHCLHHHHHHHGYHHHGYHHKVNNSMRFLCGFNSVQLLIFTKSSISTL